MKFFDSEYTGDKFYEICNFINEENPSFVFYLCIYEYQDNWFAADINNNHVFNKSEEFLKLIEILKNKNTIFYLILGSNYNSYYDYLINIVPQNFKILFWPTSILGLEYNGLLGNLNNLKINQECSKIDELEIDNNFKHLFICYNNKPTYHRCMMIDELSKNNLLNDGLYSWNHRAKDYLTNNYVFEHWDEKIQKIDDFVYKKNDEYRETLLKTQCFISLVTETSDKFIFITEKTYRQILIKQPFICLASPKHHETLKKLGFLLYDEIIDYSFDNEEKLEKRIQGIIDNLKNIKNFDYKELYKKIEYKLEFNKMRALEIVRKGLYIPEILSNIGEEYMKNEDNKLLSVTNLKNDLNNKFEQKKIWKEFLYDIKLKFKNYVPNIKSNSKYYAVVIEPRCIDDIIIMMKSTMFYLNENQSNIKWGLQIFHGNINEQFIKEMTKNWGEVDYINMNVDNLTHEEHSKYMESLEFWNKVKGEKVLIFQSDSTLIRHGIDEFLNYDYIGAPWRKMKENQIVGNGGLSIRNKEKMLEICEKYKPTESILEDIFFVKYLHPDSVAPYEVAKKFSMEDVYSENPLGVHNPIKHIEPNLLKKVLFKN